MAVYHQGGSTLNPYDYQRHDLDVLADNNYTALVNVEPGGGKTPLGLFAVKESGAKTTLIVAPEQTHRSAWIPTAEALGLEARVIGNGNKRQKDAMFDFTMGYGGVYLVTPQLLSRKSTDVDSWTGDLCIVDEGHLLNAAGTQGQRRLSGYHLNDGVPMSRRFDGRLFLSGTSWRNSFERAWGTMRFLWPDLNREGQVARENYYFWLMERMTSEDVVTDFEWVPVPTGRIGGVVTPLWNRVPDDARRKKIDGEWHYGKVKTVKKWLNEAEPGRLISEAPCVITHFRRSRCCDFHPNGFLPTDAPQEIRHVIELAPAQKKAIRELENHYITWLDGHPMEADLTLTQKQRIRQLCLGVPTLSFYEDGDEEKVSVDFDPACVSPFFQEFEEILLETGDEPIVAYVESRKFAEVIVEKCRKIGVSAFEYSGATRKDRDDMLAEFGSTYRVAVVVLSAGGTGLDGVQKVTKTEVWFERSVDETNNVQAEARADRLGGIGQVQRHILLDEMGYAEGRMSAQLEKRRSLARTLKKW